MLQSSLPALFYDTRFTVGQPDHFPEIGSGSGSRTHLKRVYEASLCDSVEFPAVEIGGVGG